MRNTMLAAIAATMLCGSAQAISYTFVSDSSAQVASFTLTLAAPITSGQIFQKSDLYQSSGVFKQVEFCVRNTRCSSGFTNTSYDEITVFNADDPNATPVLLPNPTGGPPIVIPPVAVSFSYDFMPDAFTTVGSYRSIAAGAGSLRVAATAAVPEPATWAMMLVGFGGMGYAMRRNWKVAVSLS